MSKVNIIEFWKTGENPITCYKSRKTTGSFGRIPTDRVVKKEGKSPTTAVIVIDKNGIKTKYNSVVLASTAINMNRSTLYAVLNGRCKNTTAYQIYKA